MYQGKQFGLIKEIDDRAITISGESIEIKRSIDLEFEYKGKFYNENFIILEDDNKEKIYLGNRMVKVIEGLEKNCQ